MTRHVYNVLAVTLTVFAEFIDVTRRVLFYILIASLVWTFDHVRADLMAGEGCEGTGDHDECVSGFHCVKVPVAELAANNHHWGKCECVVKLPCRPTVKLTRTTVPPGATVGITCTFKQPEHCAQASDIPRTTIVYGSTRAPGVQTIQTSELTVDQSPVVVTCEYKHQPSGCVKTSDTQTIVVDPALTELQFEADPPELFTMLSMTLKCTLLADASIQVTSMTIKHNDISAPIARVTKRAVASTPDKSAIASGQITGADSWLQIKWVKPVTDNTGKYVCEATIVKPNNKQTKINKELNIKISDHNLEPKEMIDMLHILQTKVDNLEMSYRNEEAIVKHWKKRVQDMQIKVDGQEKINNEIKQLIAHKHQHIYFTLYLNTPHVFSPHQNIVWYQSASISQNTYWSKDPSKGNMHTFEIRYPGVYLFTVTVVGKKNAVVDVNINKNGKVMVNVLADKHNGYMSGSNTIVDHMNKGDEIKVQVNGDTSHFFGLATKGPWNTFTGILIHPD